MNQNKNKIFKKLAKKNTKRYQGGLVAPRTKLGGMEQYDDARQCELEYLAAKVEPFDCKENPCSLGYKNLPSVVCKKMSRGVMTSAGPGGVGFVAVNVNYAMSEDTRAIAFSNSAYVDTNAFNLASLTGVTQAPLTGGFFTQADLATPENQPGAVSARVVAAAIRIKPAGALINTSGICVGRQTTCGGEAITAAQYDTAVQIADAYQDLTKPVFNIVADGEWITQFWNPITYAEGDLIPHEYFTSPDLTTKGAQLWLGVSGVGTEPFSFLYEVVVIVEYISFKKGVSMSKPSHQNQQVAGWIDTIMGTYNSVRGVPWTALVEGATRLAALWGYPSATPVVDRVLKSIKDDGTWRR